MLYMIEPILSCAVFLLPPASNTANKWTCCEWIYTRRTIQTCFKYKKWKFWLRNRTLNVPLTILFSNSLYIIWLLFDYLVDSNNPNQMLTKQTLINFPIFPFWNILNSIKKSLKQYPDFKNWFKMIHKVIIPDKIRHVFSSNYFQHGCFIF